MKKLVFIILMNVVFFHSYSQNLRFGVTASPLFSWISPDSKSVSSAGSKFGFKGGLVAENYFAPNYAFSLGLNIGSYGGILNYKDTIEVKTGDGTVEVLPTDEIDYKLQYVSIPVGLKFKTNQIGYFTYYAQLGFTPQINIKSRGESAVIDNSNISEELNILSVSYFFAGGFEYNIGGDAAIFIGVEYNNGFLDILKTKNSKDTQNYFTIQLGVMF